VASSFEHGVRQILEKAERARRGTRRDGGETRPLGERAERTRAALLETSYQRFVAVGYRATTVQDIHEAAGVSLGTFYQYFRDKGDVIGSLVGEVIVETLSVMVVPAVARQSLATPTESVEPYIRRYAATADFQRVWEEATYLEPDVAAMRWELTSLIDDGLRDALVVLQRAGYVNAELDAAETARALNALVDGYCHKTFVVHRRRDARTVDSVVATVSAIWSRTLRCDRT
jgi:AcrR family transcriptional regulator